MISSPHKEPPLMANSLIDPGNTPPSSGPSEAATGSGVKFPILFGAVAVLVAASAYQFYELKKVQDELAVTKDSLLDEISKVHETSAVSTQTNKHTVDTLKTEV